LALDFGPSDAFRSKEVVSPLAFVYRTHAFLPVVAKEPMHDALLVHAGDDEPADEGHKRYPGRCRLTPSIGNRPLSRPGLVVCCGARAMRQRSGRVHKRVLCPLEGEAYVDQGSYGLDAVVVLCMVEEKPLA
jgi:hypothetical protein